jgi:hypothetical protein
MENTKIELALVEEAIEKSSAEQLKQLADLQLALVGGGNGDVVFA